MKLPNWVVPVLLQLLSCAGLGSAGDKASPLTVGFSLSNGNPSAAGAAGFPTQTQPQPHLPALSLELDFFVNVADHQFKVPIMPLHLLGKKSWNVYNTVNIEKVKRDEAEAAALEAAEEERMQEADAQRRMQILRGETPTPLAIEDAPRPSHSNTNQDESRSAAREGGSGYGYGYGRERKRRKKAGENDTEFEMRMVAEEREDRTETDKQLILRKPTEAPLVDQRGHISLFPETLPSTSKPGKAEKNPEAEREAARKRKEYEDQYTMRFSNAAGFKQSLEKPWYSVRKDDDEEKGNDRLEGKRDVWGNEDPRRKERALKRIVDSDPLALMKAGARQVRRVEKERVGMREEREREMRELEEEERRRRRERRREREELEGFRLDSRERTSSSRHDDRRESEKDRERRHRHKESRKRSHREEGRHRHRHRSRHHDYD
ncbi:hypothetical protein BKA65DRAFT_456563 [Rhexocercosporidium sp. MPI-PUGE-AT-0058]|nr:hypothetical protein BKA65DRAFT_456563 [Rhexocercosporidium sp. MPI-PUGE-AT-0058]